MLNSCKITGFADEIDENIKKQVALLNDLHISYMELRTINGRGILDYSLEEAKGIKEMLFKEGIGVSSIASPIGKISITESFLKHWTEFCHAVALAKLFETPYIRIFSFYIPDGELPEDYESEVWRRIRQMIAYAKEHNVILLHENEKEIYADTRKRCRKLMEAFYGDHFRAVFDFANFVQCGEDPMAAYQELESYIAYIHIKDAIFQTKEVVPAGYGDGRILDILKKLDEKKFEGFISLEPHLAEFSGFSALERRGEFGNNPSNTFHNNILLPEGLSQQEEAFTIAYQAFKKLIQ